MARVAARVTRSHPYAVNQDAQVSRRQTRAASKAHERGTPNCKAPSSARNGAVKEVGIGAVTGAAKQPATPRRQLPNRAVRVQPAVLPEIENPTPGPAADPAPRVERMIQQAAAAIPMNVGGDDVTRDAEVAPGPIPQVEEPEDQDRGADDLPPGEELVVPAPAAPQDRELRLALVQPPRVVENRFVLVPPRSGSVAISIPGERGIERQEGPSFLHRVGNAADRISKRLLRKKRSMFNETIKAGVQTLKHIGIYAGVNFALGVGAAALGINPEAFGVIANTYFVAKSVFNTGKILNKATQEGRLPNLQEGAEMATSAFVALEAGRTARAGVVPLYSNSEATKTSKKVPFAESLVGAAIRATVGQAGLHPTGVALYLAAGAAIGAAATEYNREETRVNAPSIREV